MSEGKQKVRKVSAESEQVESRDRPFHHVVIELSGVGESEPQSRLSRLRAFRGSHATDKARCHQATLGHWSRSG